ncbi:Yip1 family protein [Streptomyces sp. NPDC051776]|uniref:Yip1 family protein n=1 Tax=Streptomyces sp. NPDC051776 TaxID=3155414 RepID=UPI0034414763
MAGFRMGRGRDSARQQGQQQPYGGQPYGGPGGRPYGGQPPPPPHGQQWQQPQGRRGGPAGSDEPEYFGAPDPYAGHGGHDPYANNPGHTQAFGIGEAPDASGHGGYAPGYGPDQGYDPYGDHVGTYRAGSGAPPAGPRLHWKQLLSGIVLRPGPTFMQMRDHPVWGPALIVTFLYGMLALFGFGKAREDALNSTLSSSIPAVAGTGIAVVISALLMGVVTHTLARQLGGDGAWQPTVGLSMLIMSITDAPRLLVAMFMGGNTSFVQIVGWATWVAAGALFTSMVSRSHDLPWPKALGASSIQLIALLALLKLGTL